MADKDARSCRGRDAAACRDRHRVRRRGRFEADGEEDDLAVGIGRRDPNRVQRRVDDPHVGAAGFQAQQIRRRSGNAQHVAVAGEDDVRPGGDGQGLVDLLERRHANRAAGAVDHPHAGRQRLVDPLLDEGVGLAAADLHQGPGPGGDAMDLVDQLAGELGVAVLVDVLHAAPEPAPGGAPGTLPPARPPPARPPSSRTPAPSLRRRSLEASRACAAPRPRPGG